MTHKIYLSEEAELDLIEAHREYESKRPFLGEEFLLCVEAVLQRIARNPVHFQVRYKDVRIAFTERFPNGIHFLIEDKTIYVQGVFHMSQNPKSWDRQD